MNISAKIKVNLIVAIKFCLTHFVGTWGGQCASFVSINHCRLNSSSFIRAMGKKSKMHLWVFDSTAVKRCATWRVARIHPLQFIFNVHELKSIREDEWNYNFLSLCSWNSETVSIWFQKWNFLFENSNWIRVLDNEWWNYGNRKTRIKSSSAEEAANKAKYYTKRFRAEHLNIWILMQVFLRIGEEKNRKFGCPLLDEQIAGKR